MSIRNEKPLEIMEQKVCLFLQSYAKDEYVKKVTAPHVAKVSLMSNHLYQDLGFKSRVHMGRFMKEHFPVLAELKPEDKLWKKFIYDSIGEVAPACEHCGDQVNCFVCKM
ncbi:MAG: nitrogen fixation protein NifQ [Campylobacterota bacterium]|nr:nitrogen fixation protein NifQ [Campylobacterota bacterium]